MATPLLKVVLVEKCSRDLLTLEIGCFEIDLIFLQSIHPSLNALTASSFLSHGRNHYSVMSKFLLESNSLSTHSHFISGKLTLFGFQLWEPVQLGIGRNTGKGFCLAHMVPGNTQLAPPS